MEDAEARGCLTGLRKLLYGTATQRGTIPSDSGEGYASERRRDPGEGVDAGSAEANENEEPTPTEENRRQLNSRRR